MLYAWHNPQKVLPQIMMRRYESQRIDTTKISLINASFPPAGVTFRMPFRQRLDMGKGGEHKGLLPSCSLPSSKGSCCPDAKTESTHTTNLKPQCNEQTTDALDSSPFVESGMQLSTPKLPAAESRLPL